MVIGNFEKGSFSAMEGTEARLKLFIKVIGGKLGVKLSSKSFF